MSSSASPAFTFTNRACRFGAAWLQVLSRLSTFAVSVQTRYGWSYRLQYRVSLTSGSWLDVGGAAAAASGDGTIKTLSDAAPSGSQRFYRVVTP